MPKVKEQIVEKIIEPPDYQEVKKECRQIRLENKRLRRLLDAGRLVTLPQMSQAFLHLARKSLREICAELSISAGDREAMKLARDLAETLHGFATDIRMMALISDGKSAKAKEEALTLANLLWDEELMKVDLARLQSFLRLIQAELFFALRSPDAKGAHARELLFSLTMRLWDEKFVAKSDTKKVDAFLEQLNTEIETFLQGQG